MMETVLSNTHWSRPCLTCVWHNDSTCNASKELHYTMPDERTGQFKTMKWNELMKIPCRFHMTKDELKVILDLHFM